MPSPIRVIKLGGSVLDQPDYAVALDAWLAQQPPIRTLMLVGGGRPVDAIRELATVNDYPTELLHWICIDLMDASFRLVADQLRDWVRLENNPQLLDWCDAGSGSAIVHVRAFYDHSSPLPIGWQTTSDSLAAWLAEVVCAQELVLIKSCPAESLAGLTWHEMAARGIVDEAFPGLVERLSDCRVRMTNLKMEI